MVMRKSKLTQTQQYKLLEHFIAGTTSRTASVIVGVNKTTASYYFHRLRELIYSYEKSNELELFSGEIEVDESYFGGTRKGKRDRGEKQSVRYRYSVY